MATQTLDSQVLSFISSKCTTPLKKEDIPPQFLRSNNASAITSWIRHSLQYICELRSKTTTQLGCEIAPKLENGMKCASTPKTKPTSQKSLFTDQSTSERLHKFEKRMRRSNKARGNSVIMKDSNSDVHLTSACSHSVHSSFNISCADDFPSLLNSKYKEIKSNSSRRITPEALEVNKSHSCSNSSFGSVMSSETSHNYLEKSSFGLMGRNTEHSGTTISTGQFRSEKENREFVGSFDDNKRNKLLTKMSSSGNDASKKNSCSKKKSRRMKTTLISNTMQTNCSDKSGSKFFHNNGRIKQSKPKQLSQSHAIGSAVGVGEKPDIQKKARRIELQSTDISYETIGKKHFSNSFPRLNTSNYDAPSVTTGLRHESMQDISDNLKYQLSVVSPIKPLLSLEGDDLGNTTLHDDPEDFSKLNILSFLYYELTVSGMTCGLVSDVYAFVNTTLKPFICSSRLTKSSKVEELLTSGINAYYFAAICLKRILESHFINLFNTPTLKLFNRFYETNLNGMSETVACSSTLFNEVNARAQYRERNVPKSRYDKAIMMKSVPYQPEYDDRSNFPNDKSFHGFKKQRDLFYSLLRDWGLQPSNDSSPEFVRRVKGLFAEIKQHSTYDHFIRLFLDQMCQAGILKGFISCSLNDSSTLSSNLNNAEKLKKLEYRVTTPSQPQNLSTANAFRNLDFFKECIRIADSYTLNVLMCNELTDRLKQTELQVLTIDFSSDDIPLSDHDVILQAILTLRIYGHFYGHVLFLCYGECGLIGTAPMHMVKSLASFTLQSLLNALSHRHLVVTLPWVVQLVSSTPRKLVKSNDGLNEIMQCLLCIYQKYSGQLSTFGIFIHISLNLLFEDEIFGNGLFYEMISSKSESLCTGFAEEDMACLDSLSSTILLNHDFYYEMDWKLNEITVLLKSQVQKSTRQTYHSPTKKVKLFTEELPMTTDVQDLLEVHFFRNQSASVKRMVSFVAERCHSNCVKHLCSDFLIKYCKDQLSSPDIDNEIFNNAMISARREASSFVTDNVRKCMIDLVLSTLPQNVLDISVKICIKEALTSVHEWLSKRLYNYLQSKAKTNFMSKDKKPSVVLQNRSHELNLSEKINSMRKFLLKHITIMYNDKTTLVLDVSDQVKGLTAGIESIEHLKSIVPMHVLSIVTYLLKEMMNLIQRDVSIVIPMLHLDDSSLRILHALIELS